MTDNIYGLDLDFKVCKPYVTIDDKLSPMIRKDEQNDRAKFLEEINLAIDRHNHYQKITLSYLQLCQATEAAAQSSMEKYTAQKIISETSNDNWDSRLAQNTRDIIYYRSYLATHPDDDIAKLRLEKASNVTQTLIDEKDKEAAGSKILLDGIHDTASKIEQHARSELYTLLIHGAYQQGIRNWIDEKIAEYKSGAPVQRGWYAPITIDLQTIDMHSTRTTADVEAKCSFTPLLKFE